MSPLDLETIRRAIREEAARPAAVRPAASAVDPPPGQVRAAEPSHWADVARLPLIGPLLRWLHGLVKAPARIRDLHQMSRSSEARLDRLQWDQEIIRDENQASAHGIEERVEALLGVLAAVRKEAASGSQEAQRAMARSDSLLLALEAWRDLSRAATHRAEERLAALAEEAARALAQASRVGIEESRARQVLAARLEWLEEWRRREDPGSIPGAEELLARVAAHFRGSEAMIAERLGEYLPLVAAAPAVAAGGAVLDLGCGRGEWLAVLKSAGVRAAGVDTSEMAVRHCQEVGLLARQEDLIAALAGCPDGSLGAVTAIQVVEHLPYPVIIRLIDESKRALAPGGLLLIETPNPDNLRTAATDFHLDPTHRQPIPARLLALFLEARGLERVSVRELHPMPEPPGTTLDPTVRAALWGPQDYVAVAWKAAYPFERGGQLAGHDLGSVMRAHVPAGALAEVPRPVGIADGPLDRGAHPDPGRVRRGRQPMHDVGRQLREAGIVGDETGAPGAHGVHERDGRFPHARVAQVGDQVGARHEGGIEVGREPAGLADARAEQGVGRGARPRHDVHHLPSVRAFEGENRLGDQVILLGRAMNPNEAMTKASRSIDSSSCSRAAAASRPSPPESDMSTIGSRATGAVGRQDLMARRACSEWTRRSGARSRTSSLSGARSGRGKASRSPPDRSQGRRAATTPGPERAATRARKSGRWPSTPAIRK